MSSALLLLQVRNTEGFLKQRLVVYAKMSAVRKKTEAGAEDLDVKDRLSPFSLTGKIWVLKHFMSIKYQLKPCAKNTRRLYSYFYSFEKALKVCNL